MVINLDRNGNRIADMSKITVSAADFPALAEAAQELIGKAGEAA